MSLVIGIPKELASDECRVALVPDLVSKYARLGVALVMESGAGELSHFSDALYGLGGITIVDDAAEVYARADIILRVQAPSLPEIELMRDTSKLVASLSPEKNIAEIKALCAKRIDCWATEYIPRISRAQSMDTLSSQASVAGYIGVIKAANHSAKFFPMLTTAAGTIRPAKVLVLGAGVAGLQAIATAKRLGAIVEAYDIREETREQCESLGAKFIDTGINATGDGGYARELTSEEKSLQKERVDAHIIRADVVITTAAIPGRISPVLIDAATVSLMKQGAVIVDLASEGGGNCALTSPGNLINHHGVIIDGPLNVASELPVNASEMFSKNLFNFISPFIEGGELSLDEDDEIISRSRITKAGEIVHPGVKKMLGEGA